MSFVKTSGKNAQKVSKRLSDICTQLKCQINSMFVSYTLPVSQNLFTTSVAFMQTTTELTVHLAAPTVHNLERLFSLL